jgi:hypothetical protein
MMLSLINDQPLNETPTPWDALAQAASLVGRVDSVHPFAHASGCQVTSRIARGLGTLKNGP